MVQPVGIHMSQTHRDPATCSTCSEERAWASGHTVLEERVHVAWDVDKVPMVEAQRPHDLVSLGVAEVQERLGPEVEKDQGTCTLDSTSLGREAVEALVVMPRDAGAVGDQEVVCLDLELGVGRHQLVDAVGGELGHAANLTIVLRHLAPVVERSLSKLVELCKDQLGARADRDLADTS